MAKSLVIVESPTKAKTINKYLGGNYTVKASLGHVKDLPKRELGIEVEDQSFEPTYEVIPGKTKILNEIKGAAEGAEAIYLAADPDREGEAISYHLAQILRQAMRGNGGGKAGSSRAGGKKTGKKAKAGASAEASTKPILRVLFHEITQKGIREAFEHPSQINEHLVDAQQARRVLDRLVGYQISPLLWDKVRRGLSAGRVQTVALRLIVEREREIRAFVPKEYWTIHAALLAGEPPSFEARLVKRAGADIEIGSQADAERVLAELEGATWKVASVQFREKRRNPSAPFTTSKLQQEAYNKLRFSAKRTMMLAQQLYEGIELGAEGSVGLITYMRTDSVRVSADAIQDVRAHIQSGFGPGYLPERPNFYKSKKEAQEAHEAIRPSEVARTPEAVRSYLTGDLYKLYRLIWQRFVASQMTPALFDQTTIDIEARDYLFRATGSVLKFDGFLAVYQQASEEDGGKDAEGGDEQDRRLPRVTEGQALELEKLRPNQHFTEPPPRYTEATLVRELEEKGIGRPSTYASIISTLVEREYTSKQQGRFLPSLLGEKVSDLLVKNFEEIFDVGFTARLEDELDEIEEGKLAWRQAVAEFYKRFSEVLEQAKGGMESYKAGIPTGEKCPKCGEGELRERISRHGFFLGCSRYPDCDYTRDLAERSDEEAESGVDAENCPNCGREMVVKRGRFGAFLACTGYPECKTTRRLIAGTRQPRQPDVLLEEKCPDCASPLVRRQGRYGEFIGCSAYPKCRYIRQQTLGIPCPKCGQGELAERRSRKGRNRVFYGCSRYPDCDFTSPHRPVAEPCPKCDAPFIVEKRTRKGAFRACLREGCDWEQPLTERETAAEMEAPVER
ncbi:MAG TPA: type I DNA topoisomerase [Patescibacteria group bacterium]|nr:type I DNA topoisomerase [Patescibacteria group bacterium]